jgi:hypothetical protein
VGSGGLQAKTEWFSSIDEQVLWNTVAIDAQVYVATQSDFSDEVAAHFAAYESADPAGKPYYVFKDGKTSFTAPGSREAYTISFPGFTGQGGKYFRIYSTTTDGDKYYVWFNLDPHLGGSTDPAIVDYTPVQVDILTGDTAAAIAQKTYNKLITGVAEAVAWGDPWPTDPGAQPTRDFYAMHNSGTNVIYLVVKGGTTTYDANVGTSGVSITIAAQGGDTINYQYARLP